MNIREWPELSWKSLVDTLEFNPSYNSGQWEHYRLAAGRK
jgi:hypothetical protein